jgi:hypothetical protein
MTGVWHYLGDRPEACRFSVQLFMRLPAFALARLVLKCELGFGWEMHDSETVSIIYLLVLQKDQLQRSCNNTG